MAYRGDRITFEEDSETQPLQQGPYTLTWDGRPDNREDFARFLGLTNLRSVPDPVIVLKAYQIFGESVFEKLIGEFALTLWSETTKTLLFVRSTCGARALYYFLDKNRLTWSSDFTHLVRVSGVALDVNENYVRISRLSAKHEVDPNDAGGFRSRQQHSLLSGWEAQVHSPVVGSHTH